MGLAALIAVLTSGQSALAARTLEQTVEQALSVAPERDAIDAGIAAGEAALRQAGAWPNPVLEMRADDRVSRELGYGGRDLTELSLTQALPIGRMGPQRAQARAALAAEYAGGERAQLTLEHTVAEAFHELQHAAALLAIARAAAADAQNFVRIERRREAEGEASRRQTLRLSIFAAQSAQQVEMAEGEFSEALHGLAMLLDVTPEAVGETQLLHRPPAAEPLAQLLAGIDEHPSLRVHAASQSMIDAQLTASRNARWPELSISAYRIREAVSGQRDAYSGVGLAISVPLWDRGSGRIQSLQAEGQRTGAHRRGERRALESAIRVRHLHLSHLLVQIDKQQAQVLEPARELLTMTQQGYEAGEVDLLDLLEATTTAHEAKRLQQRLLTDAWLELAALRHAAGRFLARPYTEITP